MPRPSRTKRAPHRDPTSLAIEAPTIPPKAIDTSQIDPDLLDIYINLPPRSPSIEPSESPPADPFAESDIDSIPKPIDASFPIPIARPFTGWTVEMEATMYSTLCTQVELGKRADSRFKKEAWQAVNKAIFNRFGVVVLSK
jgi:hypothetical protein